MKSTASSIAGVVDAAAAAAVAVTAVVAAAAVAVTAAVSGGQARAEPLPAPQDPPEVGFQFENTPGTIPLVLQDTEGVWVTASETAGQVHGVKGGGQVPRNTVVTGCWLWIGFAAGTVQEGGVKLQIRDQYDNWHTICQAFSHKHSDGAFTDDDVTIHLDPQLRVPTGSAWRVHWQKTFDSVPAAFVAQLIMRRDPEIIVPPMTPDDPYGLQQILPKSWLQQ